MYLLHLFLFLVGINMNHWAKLTVECGQTIQAAQGEDALSCTEPEWTSDIDWRDKNINVRIYDMQRYMTLALNYVEKK